LTLNSDMLAGLQHVYDVAAKYHVASVNMSIGGVLHNKPCDTNVLKPALDALRSIGVATVIAAGNDSFTSGLAEPGCISTAISVGATTKTDTIASYSNSSTWMSLWAPGSSINSSIPGGGYAFFNGTSMATPHVAGAFALARQAYPNESVTQLLARFQSNGPQITDARNGVTKRRLDIVNALRVIQVVPTTNTTTTEGNEILVPVTLSHVSFLTVSASWTTMSGTATDGTDFEHASGTVVFPPGSTSATIHIPGKQDQSAEGPEYGLVSLTNGVNAAIGGFYGVGVFNIADDD
jgi:subtilisin family serine protease